MVAFVTQWVGAGPGMFQSRPLTDVYAVPSQTGYPVTGYPGTPEPTWFWSEGIDPSLGVGSFVYAQVSNATGVTAGDVVEVTQTLVTAGATISLQSSVQQWAGTANTGKSLGVALATVPQNSYGWFQVFGNALVNTGSGLVASANVALYWNALGNVKTAAVASKQMLNATSMVVNSASFGQGVSGVTPALSATQCIAFINGPLAQSAIT